MFSASPLGYEMRDITCAILPYLEKRRARADDIIRIFWNFTRGIKRRSKRANYFELRYYTEIRISRLCAAIAPMHLSLEVSDLSAAGAVRHDADSN